MTRRKAVPDTRYASRITAEQAAQVRADHAAGVAMGEIARRLGVRRSSVQAIVQGRTHRARIPDADLERIFDDMNAKLRAELDAAEEPRS